MSSVENELRGYAVKKAAGQLTVGDEQRIEQIGRAISKDLPVPPRVAAPDPNPPAVDTPPGSNRRKGMTNPESKSKKK